MPPAPHYIRTVCPRSRVSNYSLFLPVPCASPSPPSIRGRGAGFLRGPTAPERLGGPAQTDPPSPPHPSLRHDTQQPEPAAPTPPAPRVSRHAQGCPRGPRGAAYPSASSSRSSGAAGRGSRRWAMLRGCSAASAGLRKCGPAPPRAGPGPSRPGPRRPGAPRPDGETPALGSSGQSPPAPSGARRGSHAANTPWFVARIIHTSRCFNLSLPEVRIPKRFVVRSFCSCNQSVNAPRLFCVRRSALRGNLWR